jgi:CheY-like chemotaxis protein
VIRSDFPDNSYVISICVQSDAVSTGILFSAGSGEPSQTPRAVRVLIVDDERDTTLTLTLLLRGEGYDVKGVHSGREALTALRDFEPDVMISDIAMPGMSGWELARQVRKMQPGDRPLLIAISGAYTKAVDRLLSESIGFNHYFTKPCDPNVLLRLLEPLAATL